MVTEPQSYNELAQHILRDYLRSAVIIDDQWPEPANSEPAVTVLDESSLVEEAIEETPQGEEGGDFSEDLMQPRPRENREDAQLLADLQRSLLREGLLTCGFRFTHQTIDAAIRLARRADIVVLDWHLTADDGADALKILEALKGDDLRFVCIFTGHGRVPEVRHALENSLGKPESDHGSREADLRIENLVIAIRKKQGIADESPEFTVGPDNLFSEALQGLVSNYDGLVQLTMLDLTQLHRRQLPSILSRIGRYVDSPVLLEAGDVASPVGQGGAFLGVLVDEWRAQLEQKSLDLRPLGLMGRRLFGKRLSERLRDVSEEDLERSFDKVSVKGAKNFSSKKARIHLCEWLEKGCDDSFPKLNGANLKEGQERPAGWGVLLAVSGLDEEVPSLPLLRLDAMFHQQYEEPKELTQGTVVSFRRLGTQLPDYYICATPACDATRPEKIENWFTFLRTERIDSQSLFNPKANDLAAYCVIKTGEQYSCLEVRLKQRIVLRIPQRRFDEDGSIQGFLTLGEGGFQEQMQLERVAQLRVEHALSITAAAAADAARVGVNRVEILRRRLS